MPTQNILVILHCRALTLGLQSPEPTRFASFSRNLPWPNGKFVASHSEYAYFGSSVPWRFRETPRRHLAQLTFMLEVKRRAGVRANSSDLCVS